MKRSVFSILFVIYTYALNAQVEQNLQVIKGRVTDAATNQPVAYTNIGIQATFYGTACNAEGYFELKIPGELINKNLFLSAIGYKNQVIPLADLIGKENIVIKLSPQTYDIGEIDISASSRVIMRILRSASENIPSNYLKGPFRMTGFYENEKIVDDSVLISRKANVIINDLTGYSKPGKISAFRDRGYSFEQVKKNFQSYSFPDGATNFDELIDIDWVRARSSVLNPDLFRSFDLNIADDPILTKDKLHVITFRQMAPTFEGSGEFYGSRFEGKIYIKADSYAVVKIEGWTEATRQNRQGRGLAIGERNNFYLEDVSCNFTIGYNAGIPEIMSLYKRYRFQGKSIVERTQLTITGNQKLNGLVKINRDYFEGQL